VSARVYLALGSNLGDRLAALRAAIDGLPPAGRVDQVSRVYETDPMYVADQPAFLNMVVSGWTDLPPLVLLDRVKSLETEIGRVPSFTNGPRAIDIDILLHGDTVLATDRLTLPHPRIAERAFVLAPLADIAPDLRIPGATGTVAAALRTVPGVDTIRPTAMRAMHG
jgi:2-amino-4-hydroxy-6-hydroxymethyldihydropteridine diphosphokinase